MILEDILKLSDEILGIEKEAAVTKETRQGEIDAVLRWQKDKNQKDFDFLWKSLKPVVHKKISQFKESQYVPQSSFMGPASGMFVKALETYKPSFGTSLATHLHNHLKKLYRFNLAHQNIARIKSEDRAGKITMFQNRKQFLEDKLGRPATGIELADDLTWSRKDVEKLERDLRQDWMVSGRHYVTNESAVSTQFMDKLNNLYMFETNPKEKLVMEYTYGLGGKPIIKSHIEMGNKIGITSNRVSQIKEKLAKKLTGK